MQPELGDMKVVAEIATQSDNPFLAILTCAGTQVDNTKSLKSELICIFSLSLLLLSHTL
jgi:hypothetical protein